MAIRDPSRLRSIGSLRRASRRSDCPGALTALWHALHVQPKPRQAVFDTYWRFAAERQGIFHRRSAGQPAPWTNDPILGHYEFCNTYRASDRVSQFLIREVIYGRYGRDLPAEDAFMRIVLFRLFSKENT